MNLVLCNRGGAGWGGGRGERENSVKWKETASWQKQNILTHNRKTTLNKSNHSSHFCLSASYFGCFPALQANFQCQRIVSCTAAQPNKTRNQSELILTDEFLLNQQINTSNTLCLHMRPSLLRMAPTKLQFREMLNQYTSNKTTKIQATFPPRFRISILLQQPQVRCVSEMLQVKNKI